MKRVAAILLVCAVLLSPALQASAEEIAVSTDQGEMNLLRNQGMHYVRGIGMKAQPPQSFLYENESGGLTLVEFVSKEKGVTVAEFDSDLNFLNTRTLPTPDCYGWAGFCAGEKYNFVIYCISKATFCFDQYSKDWQLLKRQTYTPGNTSSVVDSGFDVAEGGGSLYIVTNHYMSVGHQANMRLQLDPETLAVKVEQSGVDTYDGYVSHSYVPEVVCAGGTVYTFDRVDSIPGPGLFVTSFGGGLGKGSMETVYPMGRVDWGNLGNVIPVGSTYLAAFNYAPSEGINSDNTVTDAYLSLGGTTTRVTTTGQVGTPYVAKIDDTTGFIMWNPDLYNTVDPQDDLYYAKYTISGGTVTVGEVRLAPGHYLSDCEPIAYRGGIVWYSICPKANEAYAKNEITFHCIEADGTVTSKIIHHLVKVDAVAPTVYKEGTTEGVRCDLCQEWFEEPETVPCLEIEPGRIFVNKYGYYEVEIHSRREDPFQLFIGYYDEDGRMFSRQVIPCEKNKNTMWWIRIYRFDDVKTIRAMFTDLEGRPLCDVTEWTAE